MKIGWATPFNYRSAIGKFSRAVGEELRQRGHEVVMIRLETGSELKLDALDTELAVVAAHDVDLQMFDELVVNFGNHAPYHSQSISMLADRAPLGIFHDAEMRDFEWGLRLRHDVEIPRLPGFPAATTIPPGQLVAPDALPLLASLAAMCWGAVVHGPHYRRAVADYCAGPVATIPLCYPDPGTRRDPAPVSEGRRVIIFGVINEHKQVRRVMGAIAKLKRRLGEIELHLAGAIEDRYRAELLGQSKSLGIQAPLMHGYVSDEELQALIENAHAVCVLRYPVTEGGSASLATALYRQRPLIVADIASYAMIPDELVFKVSYGEDEDDLADVLLRIFQDPAAAEGRAIQALGWAEEQLSARAYVDALLPVLEASRSPATLSKLARELVPAIMDTHNRTMPGTIGNVAEVLDWMDASQNALNG